MKIFRNTLPVLLIVWPYLYGLCFLIPAEAENAFGIVTLVYVILTLVVYGLNIWNAWTWPKDVAVFRLPLYNMILKLLHIPYLHRCFHLRNSVFGDYGSTGTGFCVADKLMEV